MFEQWPSWIARNRVVRRTAIKVWRVYLRVRRACLANAVVVVRSCDDRVLLTPSPLGGFQLPTREINGWLNIDTQVRALLKQVSPLDAHASLVAVDGTPKSGLMFLYEAVLASETAAGDTIWVAPHSAASILDGNHRRLLWRCTGQVA
jgi:hypothetical protein